MSFAQHDFFASADPHAAFSEAQHDFFDFLSWFFIPLDSKLLNMKKLYFTLALFLFVGSMSVQTFAADNETQIEIKKDDKKKKKKREV